MRWLERIAWLVATAPGVLLGCSNAVNPGDAISNDAATTDGESGLPDVLNDERLPDQVVDLTVGSFHSCVVTRNGQAWCWGGNLNGQLGDGTTMNATAPVRVLSGGDFVRISAGNSHTCALRADGHVACWGRGLTGELGDGAQTSHASPVNAAGLNDAIAVIAGSGRTCAVRLGGSVLCWGQGGMIGDGTVLDRPTPAAVVNLADARALAMSSSHACARRSTGALACWGSNAMGEIPGYGPSDALSPVDVNGVGGIGDVGVGEFVTCVATSGNVSCWGTGALGDGAAFTQSGAPRRIGVDDATQLALNFEHVCVVRSNGRVACWGLNDSGQVGVPPSGNPIISPLDVLGIDDASVVGVGARHSCVLTRSAHVRCWGGAGSLGDGTPGDGTAARPVSDVIGLP